MPFYRFFLGEGSPTEIDVLKKGGDPYSNLFTGGPSCAKRKSDRVETFVLFAVAGLFPALSPLLCLPNMGCVFFRVPVLCMSDRTCTCFFRVFGAGECGTSPADLQIFRK